MYTEDGMTLKINIEGNLSILATNRLENKVNYFFGYNHHDGDVLEIEIKGHPDFYKLEMIKDQETEKKP